MRSTEGIAIGGGAQASGVEARCDRRRWANRATPAWRHAPRLGLDTFVSLFPISRCVPRADRVGLGRLSCIRKNAALRRARFREGFAAGALRAANASPLLLASPKPRTSPVAVRRQSMSRKSRSRTWMCGVPAWWTMDGLPRRYGISSSCEVPPVGCGGGWRGANNQAASNRQGRFATVPVARERRVVRCLSLSAQSARDSSRAERDKHRAAWRCALLVPKNVLRPRFFAAPHWCSNPNF